MLHLGQEKKTLFSGRRDSRKRSVRRHNLKNILFYIWLPKLPKKKILKIIIFSCSLRSQFIIQNFCPINSWFYNLKKKKNHQMGKKAVSRVHSIEQGFFFLGLTVGFSLKSLHFYIFCKYYSKLNIFIPYNLGLRHINIFSNVTKLSCILQWSAKTPAFSHRLLGDNTCMQRLK